MITLQARRINTTKTYEATFEHHCYAKTAGNPAKYILSDSLAAVRKHQQQFLQQEHISIVRLHKATLNHKDTKQKIELSTQV